MACGDPSGVSLRHLPGLALLLGALCLRTGGDPAASVLPSPDRDPIRHDFHVTARRYEFEPGRLVVTQDDIVRIALHAEDIAHSFTIDAYRIAKRANPGQPVVFEFHASQAGRFRIYCNLAIDDRCRDMHGELVVNVRD